LAGYRVLGEKSFCISNIDAWLHCLIGNFRVLSVASVLKNFMNRVFLMSSWAFSSISNLKARVVWVLWYLIVFFFWSSH
jgi:hypothetical protein